MANTTMLKATCAARLWGCHLGRLSPELVRVMPSTLLPDSRTFCFRGSFSSQAGSSGASGGASSSAAAAVGDGTASSVKEQSSTHSDGWGSATLSMLSQRMRSEGEVHLRAKMHIYNELKKSKTKKLSIEVPCARIGKDKSRIWRCRNTIVVDNWQKNWDKVEVEFPVRGIGVIDVALIHPDFAQSVEPRVSDNIQLFEDRLKIFEETFDKSKYWHKIIWNFLNSPRIQEIALPVALTPADRREIHLFAEKASLTHYSSGTMPLRKVFLKKTTLPPLIEARGIGIIEVLSTSAISKQKLSQLEKLKLDYIEVSVKPSFYEGPKAWKHTEPLFAWRSSVNWDCEECTSHVQQHLKVVKIAAMVDVYQYGLLRRKLYWILQHDHNNTFYLIETDGSVHFENEWEKLTADHRKFNYEYTFVIARQKSSEEEIEPILQARLNALKKSAEHSLFSTDIKIEWPGITLAELMPDLPFDDAFVTPSSIYPHIDLNVQPTFRWNKKFQQWDRVSETQ